MEKSLTSDQLDVSSSLTRGSICAKGWYRANIARFSVWCVNLHCYFRLCGYRWDRTNIILINSQVPRATQPDTHLQYVGVTIPVLRIDSPVHYLYATRTVNKKPPTFSRGYMTIQFRPLLWSVVEIEIKYLFHAANVLMFFALPKGFEPLLIGLEGRCISIYAMEAWLFSWPDLNRQPDG